MTPALPPNALGTFSQGPMGHGSVLFLDHNANTCELACSALVPTLEGSGTDAIWLGVINPQPVVMAIHASAIGLPTTTREGWVPFPIPSHVLIPSRMHLCRDQVKALVASLQQWLETGDIQ